MKVFVYSARSYDKPALQLAAGGHALQFTEQRLKRDTAQLAAGCEAIVIFTSDDASAPVLDILHSLGVRYILLRSAGYDHVDLKRAAALSIRVANVPEYSPNSVAEQAVAMLMAVNRKLIQGQRLMQLQDFRIDSLQGFDIHGKTVGIIGTGKIGMAFARIMLGFGAKVIAYDLQVNPEAISAGIKYESLEALLRQSDVVSLHCPLTAATRHLMSETQFSWMKPGAILVNTCRGAVINTVDLIKALDSRQLGAACLDVYEFEKGLFFEDHSGDIIHDANFVRLRSFKNVLITAHQGFLTTDAIKEIAETTINNLDCWQNGVPCKNELTVKPGIETDALERKPRIVGSI
ncbi:2-hydroxyacid dehydrogenase [Fulvivirgaceae bacterium PWU4]|uniref:2-hydroxyacid dehydrogenase n=1 Tax=Chryseosolibacter histidini TaxID=2782349 RepID=A0AAP2DQ24_9BACT|nr:2-hydroxyacid dehydrogenase [Chryseosolibacter histidini]MBT1699268.1 2-hydroxyacid dehydrogenase [Chryseosolibacter histidini]